VDEAWIVVDLGFGDQGKGTTVDFLVRDRRAHTVVRFCGGPQAAHNVVTDDGRHHTFAQLGAGTLVPGVWSVIADTMAFDPWALGVEVDRLRVNAGVHDALERLLVAEGALVVTPFHRAVNRLRERARGAARHGSCGVGFGEAVDDARSGRPTLRARDLADAPRTIATLAAIQAEKRPLAALAEAAPADDVEAASAREALLDERLPAFASELLEGMRRRVAIASAERVAARLAAPGVVVCEGAHGVLLDEDHGFHPHTTWSSCTDRDARRLLAAVGHAGPIHTLGVVRAYATRHGPGPFPSEWPRDDARARALAEPHNDDGPWQGRFRVGAFDAVLTRYARDRCGPIDGLAVTCLDRLDALGAAPSLVDAYDIDGARVTALTAPSGLAAQADMTARLARARPLERTVADPEALLATLTHDIAPVRLTSRGPTASRKAWH